MMLTEAVDYTAAALITASRCTRVPAQSSACRGLAAQKSGLSATGMW